MLQSMRDNSQGIIAKVLVGFIIVLFALWGVDSLVGLATAEPPPAEVNGVEVSKQDLFRGIELQRRQILNQMGADADPTQLDDNLLRQSVLNSLIDRAVLLDSAEDAGLFVSEQMLDQMIVATPEFQLNGKFDSNQFEATLRSAGYTPLSYRDLLRKETLIDQQRRAIAASAFVTEAQLNRLLDLSRQTRDLRYIAFQPDPSLVSVTDAELQAEYQSRQDALRAPEQLVLEYLILERAQFADPEAVSDAEINSAYQQLLADFKGEEERLARHILIEFGEDASAAEAQAAEIRDQLLQGADFAQLAAEYSQDIGSASQGGDLGYLTRGMFEGAFEDALFALQSGEISSPVETEFGYHLIQLLEVRQTQAPELVDVEADLRERVAMDKSEADYVAALERLADLSFSSADLSAPADELGLQIRTAAPLSARGGEGDFANPKVVRAAFSDTVVKEQLNSDPIELDAGRAMVVHLKEQIPARALSLDEVREQLQSELATQKAQQVAQAQAAELLAKAQAGETLDLQWSLEPAVIRGPSATLDPAIVNAAFALAKPVGDQKFYTQVDLLNGGSAVVSVDAVATAADDLTAEQRSQIAAMLAGRSGQLAYENYFTDLKANADIKIN